MYWVVYSSTHRGSYVFVALLITVIAIRMSTEQEESETLSPSHIAHLMFCC